MWRQKDPEFVALLHRARRGLHTPEDIQVLKSRIGAELECESKGIKPTRLCSHINDVDRINEDELEKLEGSQKKFEVRCGVYRRSGSA